MYAKLNITKTAVAEWLDYLPSHKPGYVLPVVVDELPEFNSETQQIIDGEPIIESNQVRKTWQIIDIVISVPQEIPLWAFRSALDLAGLKGTVATLLDSLPEPQKSIALTQWEYGNFILRNHPLILSLSSQLGLTSKEVDQIFITANSLT